MDGVVLEGWMEMGIGTGIGIGIVVRGAKGGRGLDGLQLGAGGEGCQAAFDMAFKKTRKGGRGSCLH